MNWYLHTFTQFFIQFPYKKGLNSKLKYWNWLFVIRSLLFEYSNIIQYFKKDRIRIRISLFGLLLFEYSNNELFVATLIHYYVDVMRKVILSPIKLSIETWSPIIRGNENMMRWHVPIILSIFYFDFLKSYNMGWCTNQCCNE